MDDAYQAALDQLIEYGLQITDLDTSGTLRRVGHRDDKPGRKNGWYVAHAFTTINGREIIAGAYGWHKDGQCPEAGYKIKASSKGLTETERQQLREQRRRAEQEARRARKKLAIEAAQRSAKIWENLPELGRSAYLQRKQVRAFGLRFGKGSVVVPLRRTDGSLVGLQWIDGDGGKRFVTGTAKQGAFHLIGKPEPGAVLAIAEGYATAATIYQASGWACAVAFDAGNLEPVALALREAYPRCRFVVCADDDRQTPGNPGTSKAERAADAVAGLVLVPQFQHDDGGDWNDLQCAAGLEAVEAQLRDGLARGREPPTPPGGSGGGGFGFDLGVLQQHYSLIYGTETVFDARIGRVVALSGLRAAAGKALVRIWLEHPERRLVQPENVVFDPTCRNDPTTTVNLFRGWPLTPRQGQCGHLLELWHYLCNEDDRIWDWSVRWGAYPLQHPGAKMQTAQIFHGPEGSGKNMLWGAYRMIYGEYGGVVSQQELESQFNGWASRKLFMIGNEVVSRQELYHQKGKLKGMITEQEWAINEKMLPLRMEENHCNFVFFSNLTQPATPDPDDRRYLVVWTPPPAPESLYAEVKREIERDGIEALYDYLLHVDLGDFAPHTKPIMTSAKEDLIEVSMDTPERFVQLWRAAQIGLPYLPCLARDLYKAYCRWCDANGERRLSNSVFGNRVNKRVPRQITKIWRATGVETHRLYVPPDWRADDEESKQRALGIASQRFADALQDWSGD